MYGQPDEWGAEYHTPAVRPPPSAKDALVERYCEQLRHAPTVARPELSPAYLDPSERSVASSGASAVTVGDGRSPRGPAPAG